MRRLYCLHYADKHLFTLADAVHHWLLARYKTRSFVASDLAVRSRVYRLKPAVITRPAISHSRDWGHLHGISPGIAR